MHHVELEETKEKFKGEYEHVDVHVWTRDFKALMLTFWTTSLLRFGATDGPIWTKGMLQLSFIYNLAKEYNKGNVLAYG